MKHLFLIFTAGILFSGCGKENERFEDLLQLSNSKYFVREIPEEIEENEMIGIGYRKDKGDIEWIGSFRREGKKNSIDLYYFMTSEQLGYVLDDHMGSMTMTGFKEDGLYSLVFGKASGNFSDPIVTYRLHSSRSNPSAAQQIELLLYPEPEFLSQSKATGSNQSR